MSSTPIWMSTRCQTEKSGGPPDKEHSEIRRKALDYIRLAHVPQVTAIFLTTMSLISTPFIVLDTNVVLDWLVFRDPSCAGLGQAIEGAQVRWLAGADMKDEWDTVLERGVGASRQPDLGALDQIWDRHATRPGHQQLASTALGRRCRCTDPDDQKFIDLALASGASWLLSRDRAVLKLAGEARKLGLQILPPSRWSLPAP
jgi:predicted nucleic acid-binding protein